MKNPLSGANGSMIRGGVSTVPAEAARMARSMTPIHSGIGNSLRISSARIINNDMAAMTSGDSLVAHWIDRLN
jgi:hypothetical protein